MAGEDGSAHAAGASREKRCTTRGFRLPTSSTSPSSRTSNPPYRARTRGPRRVPADERRLGKDLGLERRRGQRGGTDQPGPRGPPRAGVEQVVRRAGGRVTPQPDVEPRGRDAAGGDLQRVGDLAGERVAHVEVERLRQCPRATDAQLAAAVDREAVVIADEGRDEVGRQALAGPAGVELHAGRSPDDAGVVVDRDGAPPRRRVRPCRGTGRGLAQRLVERQLRGGGRGRSRRRAAGRAAWGRPVRPTARPPRRRRAPHGAGGARPGRHPVGTD